MKQSKDIFVFMEVRDNHILPGSLQLLGKARELVTQIQSDFKVVSIICSNDENLINLCFDKGADKAIVVNHTKLHHYNTQHYSNVLSDICTKYQPDSFLLPATSIGRDLAPRVAARLNTGLTADATQIEVEENSSTLLVTRPAFGGNLYGTIICPKTKPQMSTIRPNVFNELDEVYESKRDIIHFEYNCCEEDQVKYIERLPKPKKSINLDKAEVILSAGRGLKDSFESVIKVANELGATPGASRALVDAHIASKEYQVGQTGTTVKPKIYIAMGISGAVQHTAGMDKSDLIIAINTDPHAAIFGIADVGYVTDAKKVLPLLKEELEKLG